MAFESDVLSVAFYAFQSRSELRQIKRFYLTNDHARGLKLIMLRSYVGGSLPPWRAGLARRAAGQGRSDRTERRRTPGWTRPGGGLLRKAQQPAHTHTHTQSHSLSVTSSPSSSLKLKLTWSPLSPPAWILSPGFRDTDWRIMPYVSCNSYMTFKPCSLPCSYLLS